MRQARPREGSARITTGLLQSIDETRAAYGSTKALPWGEVGLGACAPGSRGDRAFGIDLTKAIGNGIFLAGVNGRPPQFPA